MAHIGFEDRRKSYKENSNATRDNMYTIHTNKYIEHDPCKPTTTRMWENGIDKYANAQRTSGSDSSKL